MQRVGRLKVYNGDVMQSLVYSRLIFKSERSAGFE